MRYTLCVRHGHLELAVYRSPEDAESSIIRAALAKVATGGNCPTGGHCKTIWRGKTITCEVIDCESSRVCNVWGAHAGDGLQDLGSGKIDGAKEGWLNQCYCTKVVEPVEP